MWGEPKKIAPMRAWANFAAYGLLQLWRPWETMRIGHVLPVGDDVDAAHIALGVQAQGLLCRFSLADVVDDKRLTGVDHARGLATICLLAREGVNAINGRDDSDPFIGEIGQAQGIRLIFLRLDLGPTMDMFDGQGIASLVDNLQCQIACSEGRG